MLRPAPFSGAAPTNTGINSPWHERNGSTVQQPKVLLHGQNLPPRTDLPNSHETQLRDLELRNTRLMRLVAEKELEIVALKETLSRLNPRGEAIDSGHL